MDGNITNPKAGPSTPDQGKPTDAFAIPDAAWPSEEIVTEILLSLITSRPGAEPTRVTPSTEAKTDYFRVMVAVANHAWSARNEITDPRTGQFRQEMQAFGKHIDAMFQILAEFGIVAHDHTGQPYDEGQSLKVVESIPAPGLNQKLVTETVLPSIFWNNRVIQNGEVRIATPAPFGTTMPST